MRWYKGASITKDPSDVISVDFDFGPYLGTDTISTATVTGSNITVDSTSNTTEVVTANISGGNECVDGKLIFKIVSAGGTTLERTIVVRVRQL